MQVNVKTACKVFFVFSTIVLVTMLHYKTNQEDTVSHVIYRELYFLPIILTGFWFGLRGGLVISLVITALYLPVVVVNSSGQLDHDLGNMLEIVLFNVIGILVGWLKEREIIHQNKRRREEGLTVIGQAVAYVAHDMRTPLIAIGGLVRQIRRKIPDQDRTSKKLDMALQQTERLELMVNDMLIFAKPFELNCQDNDINKLLQETVIIAEEKTRPHDVKICLQLHNGLSICSFDYHRLQQALLNLINNAVEASQVGGEVIVRSKLDKENISIEVEDYGEGISANNINEILHPFFSSKKEGTGLGLSIVKKIAEAHGGILHYERKGEKGMVFRIILPFATLSKN